MNGAHFCCAARCFDIVENEYRSRSLSRLRQNGPAFLLQRWRLFFDGAHGRDSGGGSHTPMEVHLHSLRLVAVFLLTLAWSSIAVAAPQTVAVTTCGQVVPRGAIGQLNADLDCTSAPDPMAPAVFLDRGSRLHMQGFTISGGQFGVWCEGKCQIIGAGGTIEGANLDGVVGVGVVIANVTIRDSFYNGIFAHIIKLGGVTLTGNGANGATAFRHMKVDASTVTGNGRIGLQSFQRSLKVTDSTVVDNGILPECLPYDCVDLSCPRRPSVKGSACERSLNLSAPPASWGVCSLD